MLRSRSRDINMRHNRWVAFCSCQQSLFAPHFLLPPPVQKLTSFSYPLAMWSLDEDICIISLHQTLLFSPTLWHSSSFFATVYTALVIRMVSSSSLFLRGISESFERKAAKRNNQFMWQDFMQKYFPPQFKRVCLEEMLWTFFFFLLL